MKKKSYNCIVSIKCILVKITRGEDFEYIPYKNNNVIRTVPERTRRVIWKRFLFLIRLLVLLFSILLVMYVHNNYAIVL